MPALINIAINLLFGTALVLALRHSQALRQSVMSWSFFVLLGFEAILMTPVTTYLFRFYPQWSMLYIFDPQIFPDLERYIGLLSLLAVVLNVGAAFLGYILARLAVVLRQPWMWAAPIGAAAGVIFTIFILHGDRVLFVGDYDEFWQGNGAFILTSVPGITGLVLYITAAGLIVLVRRRYRDHDPSLI
jgi:hypothetical protein